LEYIFWVFGAGKNLEFGDLYDLDLLTFWEIVINRLKEDIPGILEMLDLLLYLN
jgi:hypothetical protein